MMSTQKNRGLVFLGVVSIAGLVVWGVQVFRSADITGLRIIANEGVHIHPHLSIFILGNKYIVPSGIGLESPEQSMHTHANKGMIHIEMEGQTVRGKDIMLDRFFSIWGKPFSRNELLGYRADTGHHIRMLVNGKPSDVYERYEMHDRDQIELRYDRVYRPLDK